MKNSMLDCCVVKLLILTSFSLLFCCPSSANAQYRPRSESLPGLSTEEVIIGGVLIGLAAVAVVVIASNAGDSGDEETVPADSTETTMNYRIRTNHLNINVVSKYAINNTSYGITAAENRIEKICILRRNEVCLGLRIIF